ncbi:FRG domain-containing protein [Pseudomonas oryzihabitans]|uniref:FRG domain-containing protein n=1 Tax=Pseudomonas oryzihabitans TaxID=47885 RepID=UPI0028A8985E|nr:FRG domain-containing protein [Pseudomonas oryzihabitans]
MKETLRYIEEKEFRTVEDLLNHVVPWGSNPYLDGYVFRGHSQDRYFLVPLALRLDSIDILRKASEMEDFPESPINRFDQVQAEYSVLRRFYRLADQRGLPVPISPRVREDLASESATILSFKADSSDTWIPADLHEAAALAQHYSMPTSLLDWTYDIFVAMHFAFKGAVEKKDNLCIWALNMSKLAFLKPTVASVGIDFVTPHYAGNPHLNAQKGLFTHIPESFPHLAHIQADPDKARFFYEEVDRRPLDDRLRERIDIEKIDFNVFKKFLLPCSEARKGLQILRKLGYDESRIYPGYKGVAEQLLCED